MKETTLKSKGVKGMISIDQLELADQSAFTSIVERIIELKIPRTVQ